MSKESFKTFVRNNQQLVTHVRNHNKTWQEFYELYDLYGENNEVWNKYLDNNQTTSSSTASTSSLLGDTSLKEIFNVIKKIDLDTVKKGVDGLQKVVGLAQDIASTKGSNSLNNRLSYQRRPMYKYFED